jgi:hypothetical protein
MPGIPHTKLRCSAIPKSIANVVAYSKGQSVSYAGEQDSGFPTYLSTASITSSALAMKAGAMLKPSALAVLRIEDELEERQGLSLWRCAPE